MAEYWDVVICVITPSAPGDLGDVEDNLLILSTDTSAAGAFDVRGKLGTVNISNGRIKEQLGPTRPRKITFKVGDAFFNGRILRFADGSGLMWGHVKRRRSKVKVADEDAVWVATKGSGGIVDVNSRRSTTSPRKKQKKAVKKTRAKK